MIGRIHKGGGKKIRRKEEDGEKKKTIEKNLVRKRSYERESMER